MGTPLADRNLITFSLNAGFTFHGPFPNRGGDALGVGMGYGRVSGAAAAFDQQTAFFSGGFVPVRAGETFIELTYHYQLIPSVRLQPDFQYVFNPGGRIANPKCPDANSQKRGRPWRARHRKFLKTGPASPRVYGLAKQQRW